jgi:hypothetical protein
MAQAGGSLMGILASAGSAAYAAGESTVSAARVFAEIIRRATTMHDLVDPQRAIPEAEAEIGSLFGHEESLAESDDVTIEALAALREASWNAAGDRPWTARLSWDVAVLPAVESAIELAGRVGVRWATGEHLLFGLLRSENDAIAALLERAGASAAAVEARLHAARSLEKTAMRWTPTVELLIRRRAVDGLPWWVRLLAAPRYTPTGENRAGRVGYTLLQETNRLAVRLGHQYVQPVHLLLAAASLSEQLAVSGVRLGPRFAPGNTAGAVVRQHLPPDQLIEQLAVNLGWGSGAVSPDRPPVRREGPPWSVPAMDAMHRAVAITGTPETMQLNANAIVSAVLDEPDGAVRTLLARCDWDLDALRAALRVRGS